MEPSQTSSVSSEPHSSSTEFSSTEFTPIGRLFLEKQEEIEAEEVRRWTVIDTWKKKCDKWSFFLNYFA